MKATKILAMAMALCMMVACSQEDAPNRTQNQKQPKEGITTLTASVEGASRSAMTDGGVFSWTEGDALWVWNGTEGVEFTYDVNSQEFKGYTETIENYAIYPYQTGHKYENGNLKVNMPAEYSHGSTNAIMLAPVNPQNPTNLVFKHLGGVMRFVVEDVPVGATAFVFTAEGKAITGEFDVTNVDGEKVINATESTDGNNSVTITFNELATPQDMVFYVPLPVGEYSGYSVAIKKGNETEVSDNNESQSVANSIKRRTLLLMPSFTCEGNSITKGENNTVKLEAQEQSLNLSGSAEEVLVEVPAVAGDGEKAVLNVNFTPKAPESGSESENPVLTISDGNSGPSTESEAEVVVTMTESTIVSDLNIEAPTLTVTLASGTYGTVTAKTATETLIVKSGVTIETLEVEGGKVVVEEGVVITTNNYQAPTESEITTLEGLKSAFGAEGTYKLGAAITLDADLTVSENLALDFGGYTLDMGSYTLKVASRKTLTLSNSGTQGGASGSGDIITASESANIYIGRNVNLTSSENCCVYIPKGAEGVTVETAGNLCATGGNYAPIYVNGLVESGTIRVKGGKVEHETNTAVYVAGQVNLTIEGDVQITGETGVEIRAGRLDVNGGTITATGNPFTASANGNGSTSVGAAIAVCQHTTNYPLYANIYGGTFTGVRALYEEDLQDTEVANIGLNVKGGTFDGEIVSENCTGFVHGGTFNGLSVLDYASTDASLKLTLPAGADMNKALVGVNVKNLEIDLAGDVELNVRDAYIKLGGENTQSITVNGNSHQFTWTTTYWSRVDTTNPNATLILKDMDLTSTGNSAYTWNAWDVGFECNVTLENVNLDKAMYLSKKSMLKNVVIDETDFDKSDSYAIWIQAGADVTMDGCTIKCVLPDSKTGRGIKISDQYINSPSLTTLSVSNSSFETEKKSAVLVGSTAGAKIIWGTGNDISKVTADATNAVWIDGDSKYNGISVTATGCTVINEP